MVTLNLKAPAKIYPLISRLLQEHSVLCLHCLSKRLLKHYSRRKQQMTFALKLKFCFLAASCSVAEYRSVFIYSAIPFIYDRALLIHQVLKNNCFLFFSINYY